MKRPVGSVKVKIIDGVTVRLTDTNDLFIELPLSELETLIDVLCHYQWLARREDERDPTY